MAGSDVDAPSVPSGGEGVASPLTTSTRQGLCLRGSRCHDCATATFPHQAGCPACTSTSVEQCLLGPRGFLWTYTWQRFPPPGIAPEQFKPFAVGYVEFGDDVRVEGVLAGAAEFTIGQEMELSIHEWAAYAFRPVGPRGEARS